MSLTVPGGRAGTMTSIVEESWTVTLVAGTPPTVTVAGAAKSIPISLTDCPPDATPETGFTRKRIRGEISEVFPAGSVAVAPRCEPAATATGSTALKVALPVPSVVAGTEPRYVRPSTKSCVREVQGGSAYTSMSKGVDGVLFKVPATVVVVAPKVTEVISGKFCRLFEPVSASPSSLGTGSTTEAQFDARSMARTPLENIELPRILS